MVNSIVQNQYRQKELFYPILLVVIFSLVQALTGCVPSEEKSDAVVSQPAIRIWPSNPLIEMIDAGEIDKALQAVEKTADVNARGQEGRTALMTAVYRAGLVKDAEERLAEIKKRKKPSAAERKTRKEKIEELSQTLKRMKGKGADRSETESVERELYSLQISWSVDSWEDEDALPDVLTRKKSIKLIERLLAKGADVNIESGNGQTALANAVRKLDAEVVSILVRRDADVRYTVGSDWSLLDECLELAGGGEVALLLVRAGAELNKGRASQCDSLPIQKVIRMMEEPENKTKLISAMIGQGADVNAQDPCGRTPLLTAIWARDPSLVEFLLGKKADVNGGGTSDGRTPLSDALVWSSPEVVQVLIDKGADLCRKNSYGRTALEIAKQTERPDLVKMLQDAGAQLCTP